jgi:hypothetical protein
MRHTRLGYAFEENRVKPVARISTVDSLARRAVIYDHAQVTLDLSRSTGISHWRTGIIEPAPFFTFLPGVRKNCGIRPFVGKSLMLTGARG